MTKFTDVNLFINWVEHQRRFSPKASLDKMYFYCSLFGNPQNKFSSIHVTGTNGKGSTVASLRSILRKAGLNVATFTSPYITIFNERIQYNDEFISNEDLLKYANIIIEKYPIIENSGYELPSFFEFITLLSFIYFSEITDLDIAIIEVGMGGRLDSTNVINSDLSIITNVSYDHMNVLGDTLEKIAIEKLGIVKENTPLICGIKENYLQEIVKNKCLEKNSEVILTALTAFEIKKMDIYGSEILINDSKTPLRINLAGEHQIDNAMLVYYAIKKLNEIYTGKKRNFPISNVLLYEGLNSVSWPGRIEIVSDNPLIVIDGAHNIDAVRRVTSFISKLPYSYKRAVVSISHDKEKEKMINLLDNTFNEIIFTKYTYERSSTADELYDLSSCANKTITKDIDEAYQLVIDNPKEFTIFLGSLYLVCDIRKKFK